MPNACQSYEILKYLVLKWKKYSYLHNDILRYENIDLTHKVIVKIDKWIFRSPDYCKQLDLHIAEYQSIKKKDKIREITK